MTALGRAGLPDDIGPIASLLTEDNRWINAQRIESVWRQGHLISAIEHSPSRLQHRGL